MALINLISAGDHVEQWRAALGQYFSIVRVFDAVRADFGKRIELLRAFGAIDERWAAPLNRAADALVADRKRRARRAAAEIADLLDRRVDHDGDRAARRPQRASASAGARRRARQAARSGTAARGGGAPHACRRSTITRVSRRAESAATYLVEDVFSAQSFNVFGLSQTQLALTGAASGAVVGSAVDVALGGASLLLGAGIGAALGAFGTLAGAGSLAKVRVLGLPLGGYELTRRSDHRSEPAVGAARPRAAARAARRRAQSLAARGARRRRASRRASRGRDRAARRRKLDVAFRRLRGGRGHRARGARGARRGARCADRQRRPHDRQLGPIAGSAGTAYTSCMQYTIRRIPRSVDNAIRERARATGKSLNEAVVDTLADGAGVTGTPQKRRDLRDIAGTWKTDKAFDAALADQDRIDENLWR